MPGWPALVAAHPSSTAGQTGAGSRHRDEVERSNRAPRPSQASSNRMAAGFGSRFRRREGGQESASSIMRRTTAGSGQRSGLLQRILMKYCQRSKRPAGRGRRAGFASPAGIEPDRLIYAASVISGCRGSCRPSQRAGHFMNAFDAVGRPPPEPPTRIPHSSGSPQPTTKRAVASLLRPLLPWWTSNLGDRGNAAPTSESEE